MAGRRRRNFLSQALQNDRLATPMLLCWLGLLLIGMVWDQVLLMPSPRPTQAQLQAARPRAMADWKRLVDEVAVRQRADGTPPEFGAVWTIKTGAVCGYVNSKDLGIDSMTRFQSVGGRLQTLQDDRRAYIHWWLDCLDTPWVWLHQGTEKTGLCASRRGRESAFGRDFCDGDEPIRPAPATVASAL